MEETTSHSATDRSAALRTPGPVRPAGNHRPITDRLPPANPRGRVVPTYLRELQVADAKETELTNSHPEIGIEPEQLIEKIND